MSRFLDEFKQIGDSEVYVKDDIIVMLGVPGNTHDCDEMGCGSAGHIVAYAKGGKMKTTVTIDEREYRIGRLLCAGCGYFTAGKPPECTAPGGDCAIPWVAREHECRQCGHLLPPRTWCPSCTNSWAWPVGGKE